jgi:DNA invertase Pin-like site-specific DNA recombinase
VIRERCAAGRAAARARGVHLGRPRSVDREALRVLLAQGLSQTEAARRVGCCRSVVSHLLRKGEL